MNRRQFIQGGLIGASALAMAAPIRSFAAATGASDMTILKAINRTLEVNGKPANVLGLQRADGGHGLVLEEGEAFRVMLENHMKEPTLIHWHGLTPPWESDGVPDMPMPMIPAGDKRAYDFPVRNTGTHWMHAHTLQEQSLLAAPLIVRSKEDILADEQEVVILLHDFSFTSPEELLAGLQKGGGHGGHAMPQMSGHAMPAQSMPSHSMPSGDTGHGGHGMAMQMDINDIEYDAYLANDRTLDDPEVVAVEQGGKIRLRIINGATATGFTIDLGRLQGQLIAVDGEKVEPVSGSMFPLAMGQRADIRLELPRSNDAFPVFALREGARQRTGIILQPKGSSVTRLGTEVETMSPILDLALEKKLRTLNPLPEKAVDRSFAVDLNGTMEGYRWTMDMDKPVLVRLGQRVEITMHNKSMMAHPMHLHGHHFQVVAIDGQRMTGARRDTVNMPPHSSVTIAVDANNPGKWAFHCHHLYHMAAGMMSTFAYED